MYSFLTEPRCTIRRLGDAAMAGLGPGQARPCDGRVSKAVYLRTETGDLFWLVTPDAPMHRRAARSNGRLPKCSPGSPYSVQDKDVIIGRTVAFDVEHADVWRAPRIEARLTVTASELSNHVQAFFHELDLSHSTGFGAVIPQIMSLSGADFPQRGPFRDDLVLDSAQPRLLEAARACLHNAPDSLCASAIALIGLGGGLTPSGDDFVGGLLFCLKHLGQTRLAAKLIEVVTRAEFLALPRTRSAPQSCSIWRQDMPSLRCMRSSTACSWGKPMKGFILLFQNSRESDTPRAGTSWPES